MGTLRLKEIISLALFSFSFTYGQISTNLGFYDGRIVHLDDSLDGGHISHTAHSAVAGVGVVPVGSLGVHSHGSPSSHAHHGAWTGSLPTSGVLGSGVGSPLAVLPGHGIAGSSSLQQCPGLQCTFNVVLPRCRFTPVMRSAFGGYCLGCTEDICDISGIRRAPNQRRRRRRIRRRLCRQFGICSLDTMKRPLGGGGGGRGRRRI